MLVNEIIAAGIGFGFALLWLELVKCLRNKTRKHRSYVVSWNSRKELYGEATAALKALANRDFLAHKK
jgi:hypothetical protein